MLAATDTKSDIEHNGSFLGKIYLPHLKETLSWGPLKLRGLGQKFAYFGQNFQNQYMLEGRRFKKQSCLISPLVLGTRSFTATFEAALLHIPR